MPHDDGLSQLHRERAGRRCFRAGCDDWRGLLSGPYRPERQDDGDFAIRNLDIFQATQRQNPKSGKVDKFDEKWLREAVEHFQELKVRNGYLPPVHAGHHDPKRSDEPPFIGHLDNLRVEKGDNGVATLFADVVDIPPEMFKQVARKRFPYRSIEVNNPNGRPAVSSCSFMATVVPYHKMRMLRFSTSDLQGVGKFWDDQHPDRVCFGEMEHPRQTPLVAVGRFLGGEYKPLTEPTRFAQRFMAKHGDEKRSKSEKDDDQQFNSRQGYAEDDDPEAGMDDMGMEGDDLDGLLSEEELAGMDDMDGLGGDEGYEDDGFDLDPMEQDELSQEGMDMGQLADALNNMAGAIGQQNQKLDTVLQQVQSGQARDHAGVSGNPPPVGFKEGEDGKQSFSESKDDKPKGTPSIERLVARVDALFEVFAPFGGPQKFCEWAEGVQAFADDINEKMIAGRLNNEAADIVEAMEEEPTKFSEREVQQAVRHFETWRDTQIREAEDTDKIDVRQCFREFLGEEPPTLADAKGEKELPPRSRGDNNAPPAPGKADTEDNIAHFCEQYGNLAVYFREDDPDRDKSVDAFKQAEGRWSKMSAAEQAEFDGEFNSFVANVMTRQLAAG